MELLVLIIGFTIILVVITAIDTCSNGFFIQERIGQFGKPFYIYKLRTLHEKTAQVSFWGLILRKSKLDELPQLINIIKGEMTFVGPRPDVPGYADKLQGEDKLILNLKPGITGLASLKYRNEEYLLAQQPNPKQYNDEVIWPDKVRINIWYAHNKTLLLDLKIIFYTLVPITFDIEMIVKKRH